MKKVVIVKADTNDADYVTREEKLEEFTAETMEIPGWDVEVFLKKVAKAIKDYKSESGTRHNWVTSDWSSEDHPSKMYEDVLTEEEIQIFCDCFCPTGEYGIHTIESIRIITIFEEERIF